MKTYRSVKVVQKWDKNKRGNKNKHQSLPSLNLYNKHTEIDLINKEHLTSVDQHS